jgi:hypothetical protein
MARRPSNVVIKPPKALFNPPVEQALPLPPKRGILVNKKPSNRPALEVAFQDRNPPANRILIHNKPLLRDYGIPHPSKPGYPFLQIILVTLSYSCQATIFKKQSCSNGNC